MKIKSLAALLAFGFASTGALATNGYFSHGYGMKAKGMAGVGIALPQDALAAATNPAGIAFTGDRVDFGLDWFSPKRSSEIVGNAAGLNGNYDGNGKSDFFIPEFGYTVAINDKTTFSIPVYGNGGMNTQYGSSPFRAFGGTSPYGMNMEQLFVAPTFAFRTAPNHSLGVSLVYGYQTFSATGLNTFSRMSSDAGNLTDRGTDTSTGWGLKFGWTAQMSDTATFGLTYSTRMKMSKFGKYQGLFAEQGDFDIPENYGAGIAIKVNPKLTWAADIQQINFGKVKSVGTTADCLFVGCRLGADNGGGFGWGNMTVFKLGVAYEMRPDLTLRGGFSTGSQPIASSQTMFNTLAPGVIENHLTLGSTWTLANKSELTLSYMHAFSKTVGGSGSIRPGLPAAGGMGGGEANLKMYQNSLGIGYGWKF